MISNNLLPIAQDSIYAIQISELIASLWVEYSRRAFPLWKLPVGLYQIFLKNRKNGVQFYN